MRLGMLLGTTALILFLVGGNSQTNKDDLCDWTSKTAPEALMGNNGTSSKDKYWFTHLSDVDTESTKNHFVHAIRNNHPDNYLPAEWDKAQIEFDRIFPGLCGANDFESFLSFKEDPNAPIKYGPAKQYSKDASVYIKDQAKKQNTQQYGPPLRSRIIADLDQGKPYRLHVEFTTEVEGKQFKYSVINRGSKDQLFEIPSFTDHWGTFDGVKFQTKWETNDKYFVTRPNKEIQTEIVSVERASGFQEELVTVRILSTERKQIAKGMITVYLPQKR